jgi:hypothetical protein
MIKTKNQANQGNVGVKDKNIGKLTIIRKKIEQMRVLLRNDSPTRR